MASRESNVRVAATRDKAAHNKRMREWLVAHPEAYEKVKQRTRDRLAACRSYVWNYKLSHPCVDCGESDPIVLDFDHRDPRCKVERISQMKSIKAIAAEIEKCDVRCANCHRRRTHLQRLEGVL